MATNVRDPRSIITPDAFTVSDDLLGIPLGRPWRRFWALVIDVVVIAFLSAATDSISLFIWGGVGLFLVSMAFRRPAKGRGQTAGMLFRGATGCLGGTILAVAILAGVGGALLSNLGGDGDPVDVETVGEAIESGDLSGLDDLGPLSGVVRWGGRTALAQATDTAAAREAAVVVLIAASPARLPRDEWRDLLDDATPPEAVWADRADIVYGRAIAEVEAQLARREAPPEADVRLDEALVDSLRAEAESLGDQELLATWLEVLRADRGAAAGAEATTGSAPDPAQAADAESPPSGGADAGSGARAPASGAASLSPAEAAAVLVRAERRRILQSQVVQRFAADTVAALSDALAVREREAERVRERAERLEGELEEQEGSFVALLSDIWDQLGSAFGLWSVYFTVALTLTRGRTVGKKLLGLRVLRLDGEPLTWWASFERAGGYAAGIATGTLGFVQIFWDANRQAVHDKIGGTVVVEDGAAPLPGAWEQAWRDRGGPEIDAGRGTDAGPGAGQGG